MDEETLKKRIKLNKGVLEGYRSCKCIQCIEKQLIVLERLKRLEQLYDDLYDV